LEIVKPLTSNLVQSNKNMSKPLPDTPPEELTPAAGKLLNSPTVVRLPAACRVRLFACCVVTGKSMACELRCESWEPAARCWCAAFWCSMAESRASMFWCSMPKVVRAGFAESLELLSNEHIYVVVLK
jgi:hypothetical protein